MNECLANLKESGTAKLKTYLCKEIGSYSSAIFYYNQMNPYSFRFKTQKQKQQQQKKKTSTFYWFYTCLVQRREDSSSLFSFV